METKIDNFDLIKTLLNFDTECFYFLQILQRKKENPQIGSNSNVIATYYIKSIGHLERLKPEITMLCKLYNARAYINLNKRIQEELCLPMIKKLVSHMENKDFSTIHRIFNSVSGTYNKSTDKIWIIDIDNDTPESIEFISEFINNLQPEGYKIIATVPTVSGIHLLTTPFNSEHFKKQFPNIDIQKNNPTILYYEKTT